MIFNKNIRKILVATVLVLGLITVNLSGKALASEGYSNFKKVNTYSQDLFQDVDSSDWYSPQVKLGYELGLLGGKGNNKFDPEGSLTLAETIKLASNVHSVYYGKTISNSNDKVWYESALEYCYKNKIIDESFLSKDSNFDEKAKRYEMAYIFSNILSLEKKINNVDIPDVSDSDTYYKEIKKLYEAGVLTGSDAKGTFNPNSNITRAEAVTILNRVVNPELRKGKEAEKPVVSKVESFGLNENQKHRAEALTSVFENGSPTINYEYAENIGDGRGFTCGRAGFTTGTGDVLIVVKKYTELQPNNVLAKYLPELKVLENERIESEENQGDTSGLQKIGNFSKDWTLAAKDANFRKIQDSIVEELYYKPAMDLADSLGLKFALSKAALYDAVIQHGNGDDPDSLKALIAKANKNSAGSPNMGIDEKVWLNNFINARKATLLNSHNESTREEWAKSADRAEVYRYLLKEENYNLDKTITIKVPEWNGIVIQ